MWFLGEIFGKKFWLSFQNTTLCISKSNINYVAMRVSMTATTNSNFGSVTSINGAMRFLF